jgi:hypothetical protein
MGSDPATVNIADPDDDESVFRRVSRKSGHVDTDGSISPVAFRPHPLHDHRGLSLSRCRSDRHPEFLTKEEFANTGSNASGYYLAEFNVGVLRAHGLRVIADPIRPDNLGHVLLPELNSSNESNKQRMKELQLLLATRLVKGIYGPYCPLSEE